MELLEHIPVGRKSDSLTLLNLLTLELGSVAHGLFYANLREGDLKNAYLAEARIGLCDLVLVARQLAERENWSWADIIIDGRERFIERMQDARNVENTRRHGD